MVKWQFVLTRCKNEGYSKVSAKTVRAPATRGLQSQAALVQLIALNLVPNLSQTCPTWGLVLGLKTSISGFVAVYLYYTSYNHTFFSHLVRVITQVLLMWQGFVSKRDTECAGFRVSLAEKNPDWLGKDMIETVRSTVTKFSTGYTVPNLLGSQVFLGYFHIFTKGPWSFFFDQFFHHGFHAWPISILYIFLHGSSTKAQWIWR